ncbi:NAD-dependent epimerase/dehydratase family protein [Plantactinospora sp. CA-290183]|uniref:NAD-dependent epimerase/dehydratase family protein n=1 Tax=Plantactinospora sp. CA-290183 TaxID=3240006 RepID=UPI003D933E50
MRLLVLGGTVFLGRAVARRALAAGHDVTCAARGSSGDPVEGARFVRVDRDDPDGLAGLTGDFDAVVDVARHPARVRHAIRSLAGRVGHVTFVSSGSAYADTSTPHQRVDTAPLLGPAPPDAEDPWQSAEAYGACKVSCERLLVDAFGADNVFLCRAGLIVGPEDPIGRFEYWLRRAARGGEVLVPGTPDDLVQLVDVRDLADWIVDAAQRRLAGAFDGTGEPMRRADFLAGLLGAGLSDAGLLGAGLSDAGLPGAGLPDAGLPGEAATLSYVPQEFLLAHGVAPWSGPRSLPIWLPVPEYAGFMSRDVAPSLAAGLRPRPLAETARDTAGWLAAGGAGARIGLTEAEETDLLNAWR